jgi:hypothetical protein
VDTRLSDTATTRVSGRPGAGGYPNGSDGEAGLVGP